MLRRLVAYLAPTPHAHGVLLVLLSVACFTTNVLLIRALGQFQHVNVWLVVCARFVVGLTLVAVFYRREFAPANLWRKPKLVLRGLAGGLSVAAFYFSIVHLGAGRATFINNTYVIFGALLAVWILHERFQPALATGSVATLVGLALLTNAFAANTHPGFFDLVALSSSLAAAYVVVTIRQLHATEHTSTIFAAQCAYGLLFCVPLAATHHESIGPMAWGMMILAGTFATGGQIAMTQAFRELPVAEGSLLQMLVPLGVALGGAIFFHERFALHELAGAALILAGCTVTALRR